MPHCSVLGSCKNICYKSRLVLISTYFCMMPRICTACFMCLLHSRADVKWERLKENNFNIVLLRGGKQWEPCCSTALRQMQIKTSMFQEEVQTPMWLQFTLWSLLDGNTCTIHQEGEYEGVSNVMLGMSPLLSEHPDPCQGQEEVQSGCTRLAALRGMDPGSTRQERRGNPGQCHPGCRIELPGERAAMHFSLSVKSAFLSPNFFKGLSLFLSALDSFV